MAVTFGRSGAAGGWVRTGWASRLVFVSYSHADHIACRQFLKFLEPLCERLGDKVWVDRERLDAGDCWRDEIGDALDRAAVFIVLMSQEYRASTFCMDKELAPIMARQAGSGVRVIGIALHELTLADFSVCFADGASSGLEDFQCLPQGVQTVHGVSREGLVPLTRWPVAADAWHEVQVQLERALVQGGNTVRVATRTAAPQLRPVPADFPTLSPPYLCDRHDQSDLLALTLAEWHDQRCVRPLLLLTEGDEQDCLSEWIDRVATFEVAQALPLFDEGELAFNEPLVFAWPGGVRDEADARRRLTIQLARTMGRNVGTPLADLQAELVTQPRPTFWWTELSLSEGSASLAPGLRALAAILSSWPDLAPQGPLVVALNMVLDATGTQTESDAVRAGLWEASAPAGFRLAELGRLPRVGKTDLTAWAKARHVQPRLPRPSIDTLRDRLSAPQPMREFVRLYNDWVANG